jgi:hypothetical protein
MDKPNITISGHDPETVEIHNVVTGARDGIDIHLWTTGGGEVHLVGVFSAVITVRGDALRISGDPDDQLKLATPS